MNRTAINIHLANSNFGRKSFTLKVNPSMARYEACAIVWNVVRNVDPTRAAALKAEAVRIWEGTK